MPKKPLPARRRHAAPAKRRPQGGAGAPLLRAEDVRTILSDLAVQIAPADVETLMSGEEALRARADTLQLPELALLQRQLSVALDCLRDHVDGSCPQIPYYTITLLAAAVCYFSDELDVVPDFLPRIGQLDDALVMAMACRLGEAGLRRYCTFKDIAIEPILTFSEATRRPRRATRR